MKTIEVDDELYRYIASQTKNIGESASDILRRLLMTSQMSVDGTTTISKSKTSAVESSVCENEVRIEPMVAMQSKINSKEFLRENKAIGRFMMLLSALYHIDNMAFSDSAEIKGRTRIYFAENKDVLLATGQASKPKQIPDTPYWVITNTNTKRKQQIVQQLMEKMRFQSEFISRVISTI